MMIGYHHYQRSYDSSDLFLGNYVHANELHHAENKILRFFVRNIFMVFLGGALTLLTFLCNEPFGVLASILFYYRQVHFAYELTKF